ncbi:MAG: 4Fe-4S binding protein [Deltaproteobacteria bacterium]|nr:4Fe-4S binding protein [Deltaproteobacteria bacterium]
MSDQEIYKKFIEWLGNTWWELTESEHLMPTVTSYITPEDAAFLTGMPFSGKSLEEMAAIKEMDPAELAPRLKELAQKGLIYESIRGDSTRYRLSDSFFLFLRTIYWSGKTSETIDATTPHLNKYFMDGWFDQYADTHAKGLRTIPVEKTVEDTRQVLPFEDIVKVIEDREYYTVSACPCRMRHNIDPNTKDCNHPLEVCLHFDELGRYIVKNDMGREITKEETFEILKKAADAGLVHGISNWENNPDTICNCCVDSCIWFEAFHQLGHDRSLDPSNYQVQVTAETCRGCALCVKRCPMDAIQLQFSPRATNKFRKVAVVNTDLCIGCGVCAHKCPTDSLVLARKEEITTPPKTVREYGARYLADRREAREKREAQAS